MTKTIPLLLTTFLLAPIAQAKPAVAVRALHEEGTMNAEFQAKCAKLGEETQAKLDHLDAHAGFKAKAQASWDYYWTNCAMDPVANVQDCVAVDRRYCDVFLSSDKSSGWDFSWGELAKRDLKKGETGDSVCGEDLARIDSDGTVIFSGIEDSGVFKRKCQVKYLKVSR